MILHGADVGGSSGIDTGDVGHSLRFRASASANLSRTFGTPTNQTSWAFSCFIKRGVLGGANKDILSANNSAFILNSSDQLYYYRHGASAGTSTAVLRDPTAACHLFIRSNGTNIKAYLNTVEIFSYAGTDANFNTAILHRIGAYSSGVEPFDGYMSRIAFVDNGGSLTPQDFVYLNTDINEYVSKTQAQVKAVVDAGGTNSFMLDFDDGTSLTTLGYDKSAKGNNWTLNNFSLTAGAAYDWMLDVPGNSYCTLNPLDQNLGTTSDGNLKMAGVTASFPVIRSTRTVSSGKWVFEWVISTASGTNATVCGFAGVGRVLADIDIAPNLGIGYYSFNGNKYLNGTATAYGAAYGAGNIIRCELDLDALQAEFFKDGTSQGLITGISAGTYTPYYRDVSSTGANAVSFNYGQAPLSTGAAYYGSAGGYFEAAPTAGFQALCQRNLPAPAILNPKNHFDVVTRVGTAASYSVTGIGFQPDLVWSKSRGRALDHALYDSVRGVQKQLESNQTGVETTESTGLTAFNSDGYTGGALDQINGTTATNSFIDWLWKAGGAPVTNTAGSITSQVSANVEAGFSIVSYTGTGAAATVGHGLSKAPELVITFNRTVGTDHFVYHSALTSAAYYIVLSTTAGQSNANGTNVFNTAPSATIFSVGNYVAVNAASNGFVAYCFHSVNCYSKISSFVGNASADGIYVDLGFKPAFVMIKASSTTGNWTIFDSKRPGYNVQGGQLWANLPTAEATTATLDFTSTGFKARLTTDPNSAQTFVFYAVAEAAGKFSLAR